MQQLNRPVSVAMVGIGGYGYYYLRHLINEHYPQDADLIALVDPCFSSSTVFPEFRDLQLPVFASLAEFYSVPKKVDLVIISSPMHFHADQIELAMQNGAHVLCEKPLAVTVQDADHIIRRVQESGKKCLVGFQWSYSRAIQSFKSDIGKGLHGRPKRFKTLCFWPRDNAYYQRNDWAGRIKDDSGRWILDSPAGNAMSHFLHNMFYLLGRETEVGAVPDRLAAELYGIYPIENYDSAACRIFTAEGIELLFYASHAVPFELGPEFVLEFENSRAVFGINTPNITVTDQKGRKKIYGSPEDESHFKKISAALEAVNRSGSVVCGPEASRSQILAVNGMQESMPEPIRLPEKRIEHDHSSGRSWSPGLADLFVECYKQGVLPSETKAEWTRLGKNVALGKYHFFPGGGENSD